MRKKMKKRLISFVAVFIVALMAASPVMGTKKQLTVPRIVQAEDESCCWACAGTSICQYYGISVSLDQFIFSVKATTSHYVAGSSSDVLAGLRQQKLTATLYSAQDFYFSHVVSMIDAGKPVIGSGETNGYPHMYVIAGYDNDTTAYKAYFVDSSIPSSWDYFIQHLSIRSGRMSSKYDTEEFIVAYK